MKIILAKDTDHEFEIELPFNSKRELCAARAKFKKEVFGRSDNGPCWEFYLQFLDSSYKVDYIKPNKDRGRDFLIRKYGEEEGEKRYQKRLEKDKIKNTLDGFIQRYGSDVGQQKYIAKNKKLSVSEESLKLNGYSDAEILEIRKRHANKSARTLQNYVNEYGCEEGKRRYEQTLNNGVSHWKLSYWIGKGFSEDDAKKIVSNLQRRDLNYFVNKYGKEDGQLRYAHFNKKRISATRGRNVSKLEILLYEKIQNTYSDSLCTETIGSYVVDILIPSKKLVIEIFGDYWHCNPLFWQANDFNKTIKMKAEEKWKKDKDRIEALKKAGYNVVVVWENETNNEQFDIEEKINESNK